MLQLIWVSLHLLLATLTKSPKCQSGSLITSLYSRRDRERFIDYPMEHAHISDLQRRDGFWTHSGGSVLSRGHSGRTGHSNWLSHDGGPHVCDELCRCNDSHGKSQRLHIVSVVCICGLQLMPLEMAIIIAGFGSATIAYIATASRMTWAFARERGLPGSGILSRVRLLLPPYSYV